MWISICTVYFVVGHQDFVKRSNSASSSIRSTKNTPSSWAVVLGLPYNKSSLLLLKILIGRNVKSSVPKRHSLIFKVETALLNQTARRNALILAHRPQSGNKEISYLGLLRDLNWPNCAHRTVKCGMSRRHSVTYCCRFEAICRHRTS